MIKLEVGKKYVTRRGETVVIESEYPSGGVIVYFDHLGRTYFSDGVPTTGGVKDDFRIVSKV